MSTTAIWIIFAVCVAGTVSLVGVARAYALQNGLLDIANARSSHAGTVPRGGGIAFVVMVLAAAAVVAARGRMSPVDCIAWLGGGLTVALVGYLDDHKGLSVATRLIAHLVTAIMAMYAVRGLPSLRWGVTNVDLGMLGSALAVLSIIWSINLFNFMDGIDGIAAQEALFMAGGGWLLQAGSGSTEVNVMLCAICGSAAGFLVWNWAPARIFMGDVGSGFLGYVLALIALISCREGSLNLWTWLILGGLFVSDATVTLMVRVARRVRVFSAHREHVYQRIARRASSHAHVSIAFFAINVSWLLPWASASTHYPKFSMLFAAVALTPTVIAAFLLGAGQEVET